MSQLAGVWGKDHSGSCMSSLGEELYPGDEVVPLQSSLHMLLDGSVIISEVICVYICIYYRCIFVYVCVC